MPNRLYKLLLSLGLSAILVAGLLFYFRTQPVKEQNKTPEPKPSLEVDFLDVGQGDAILVKTPKGQNVLIDGGPDASVMAELSSHLPWYENTIDLVILSHPHDDHVGGLVPVFKKYEVKRVAYTGILHNSPAFLAWLKLIKEKHIPLTIIDKPQKISLDDETFLEILYPAKSLLGKEMDNLNNSSVVAKLSYKKTSFLLTGDLEEVAEKEMISYFSDRQPDFFKADVLKAGHHGSVTSSSEGLLDRVKPTITVISVGKDNQFGHPSLRVLKRLEKRGIEVFRTDLAGTVVLKSDGEKVLAGE